MKFKKQLTVSALLLSSALFASQATHAAEKPGNPLGDCGIGAAIFPNYEGAAVISNIIWDLGTTALTSATMSPESCPGVDREAAAFIMESYDSLVEDTARGEGEYLSTLATILDISEAEKADFVAKVRSEMQAVIASEEYVSLSATEKASRLYTIAVEA